MHAINTTDARTWRELILELPQDVVQRLATRAETRATDSCERRIASADVAAMEAAIDEMPTRAAGQLSAMLRMAAI